MVDSRQAAERARESLEWHADFEAGQFHIHCHSCGKGEPYLPPEFFGLAHSDRQSAEDVLALAAALADAERERAEDVQSAEKLIDELEARVAELETVIRQIRDEVSFIADEGQGGWQEMKLDRAWELADAALPKEKSEVSSQD